MGGKCSKSRSKARENMEKLIEARFLDIINKDYKDNHRVYFEIMNEKLRNFYNDNRKNQMKISLSLDKKDFSSISSAKKFSINSSEEILHWKEYLLKYLDKKSKKSCKWCFELSK